MNLVQFISDKNVRNLWIEEPDIRVYVRKSMRLLNVDLRIATPCLDLGTVEVDAEKRGTGVFTRFLARFEQEAEKQRRAVYVESILEPRLYQYLLKRGYQDIPGSSEISPTVFKVFA